MPCSTKAILVFACLSTAVASVGAQTSTGHILDDTTALIVLCVLLGLSVLMCVTLTVCIACVCWRKRQIENELGRSQGKSKLISLGANPAYDQFTPPDLKQVKLKAFANSETSLRELDLGLFQDNPTATASAVFEDEWETSFTVIDPKPEGKRKEKDKKHPRSKLGQRLGTKESMISTPLTRVRGNPTAQTLDPKLLLPNSASQGASSSTFNKQVQTGNALAGELAKNDTAGAVVLVSVTPEILRKNPAQLKTPEDDRGKQTVGSLTTTGTSQRKTSRKGSKASSSTMPSSKAPKPKNSSASEMLTPPVVIVTPEMDDKKDDPPKEQGGKEKIVKTSVSPLPRRKVPTHYSAQKSSVPTISPPPKSQSKDSISAKSKSINIASERKTPVKSKEATVEQNTPLSRDNAVASKQTVDSSRIKAAKEPVKEPSSALLPNKGVTAKKNAEVVKTTLTPVQRPKAPHSYLSPESDTPKLKPPPANPRGRSPRTSPRLSAKNAHPKNITLAKIQMDSTQGSRSPRSQRYVNFVSESPRKSPGVSRAVKPSVSTPENLSKNLKKVNQSEMTHSKSSTLKSKRESQYNDVLQDIDDVLASFN